MKPTSKNTFLPSTSLALHASLVILATALNASAAVTWDGGAGTDNPATAANWNPDVAPGGTGNLNGFDVEFGAAALGSTNTMNYTTGGNSATWTFLAAAPAMTINLNSNQFGAATGPNVFVNNSSFTQTFTGTPSLFDIGGTTANRTFDANTASLNMPGFTVRGDASPASWNIELKGNVSGSVSTGNWGGSGGPLAGKTIGFIKNGTGSWTLSGNIANIGATAGTGVTVNSGLLTLSGANTYTGATTVNGGTLLLNKTGSGAISASSALVVGGGNFSILGAPTGATTQTVASLAANGNGGGVIINPNGGTSTTLTITSNTLSGTGGVNFNTSAGTPSTAIIVWNPTLTGGIIGGGYTITDNGGTGFATIASSTVTRYTAGTVLTPTNPTSAATDFLINTSGTITNSVAGAALSSLSIDTTAGANTWNLVSGNTATITTGGIVMTGVNDFTISNGTLKSNTATNSNLVVSQYGTGIMTIDSVIANGLGASTVIKNGGGTLVLSGANTYTGSTTVTGGTLTLSNSLALQNSALDTTASITGTSTTGLKTTVTALTLGALTGNKNLPDIFTTTSGGYSGLTALTLNPATAVTYSGNVTNGAASMTLTKTGVGTQTLSGTNGYTGATNVNVGTLAINSTGALGGTSGVTVANNAELLFNQASVQGPSTPTVYGAPITITGNGNGALSGAIRFNAPNNRSNYSLAGQITLGGSGLNSIVSFNAGNNYINLTGSITGTGGLELQAGGANSGHAHIFTLAGTLDYQGATQFETGAASGRVILSNTSLPTGTVLSLGAQSNVGTNVMQFDLNGNNQSLAGLQNVVFNSAGAGTNQVINTSATAAILTINNSVNYAFSGNIGANGLTPIAGTAGTGNNLGLTKTGSGLLTLTGANTYTGVTSVTDGVLATNGTSIPDAGALAISGTGTVNITGTETVGALTLAGVVQAAGTYDSTNSAGFITSGSVLVTGVSDYATWISSIPGTFSPTTPTADADGDGLTNQQEYAFGLIPNSGSSVNPISVPLNTTTGVFKYTRRLPSLTSLTYNYQYSTNLGSWSSFTPSALASTAASPVEEVTVTLPAALLVNPSLFIRVTAQ